MTGQMQYLARYLENHGAALTLLALIVVLIAQAVTILVVYLQLRRWRLSQRELLHRGRTWDQFFVATRREFEMLSTLIRRQDFSSFFASIERLEALVRRYEILLGRRTLSSDQEKRPRDKAAALVTAYLNKWGTGDFKTRADIVASVAAHVRHTIGTTLSGLQLSLDELDKTAGDKIDSALMMRLKNLAQTIVDKLEVFKAPDIRPNSSPEEPVELSAEIRRMVDLLVLASSKTINTTYELQEGVRSPLLLVHRLSVPIDSIIENATEEVKDNGRIRVSSRLEGQTLVVEISNDGPPINEPPERLYSGGFSTKGGDGQGLAVAKVVVEEMLHGRLSHRNEPDGWVTFAMSIPIG